MQWASVTTGFNRTQGRWVQSLAATRGIATATPGPIWNGFLGRVLPAANKKKEEEEKTALAAFDWHAEQLHAKTGRKVQHCWKSKVVAISPLKHDASATRRAFTSGHIYLWMIQSAFFFFCGEARIRIVTTQECMKFTDFKLDSHVFHRWKNVWFISLSLSLYSEWTQQQKNFQAPAGIPSYLQQTIEWKKKILMNHFSVEKLCGFILKWSWPSGYPSIYLDYQFICSTILSVSPPHCLRWCFYTRDLVNIKICLDCHTLVNFSSITRLFQGVWNRLKRHVSTSPPKKTLKKSRPPTWRSNHFHPLWHVALPLSLHSEGIALKNLGARERASR